VSRTHLGKDFWLTALRGDGAAFLASVSQGGALSATSATAGTSAVGAIVPSCPDWSVGDLVRHLGAVYRRTRSRIGSGDPERHWGPVIIPDDAPGPTVPGVVSWFAAELAELDASLDAVDPDAPAWNWAPQAKKALFWHRRCAHETAIHRWDAQLATGLPEPLEGKLAGDTVTEALDTFLPAGRRRAHSGAAGLAHLVAHDLAQHWYLRLRADG
jgi:uncharacterized protein (TIGR03083 family)